MHEADLVANTVRTWLGNPISRRLLKWISKRDEKGSKLEKVLRKYSGEEIDLGFQESIAYQMVKFTIERGSKSFGVPEEEKEKFIESLKIPIVRRGLTNILEGIGYYGIQRPQTTAAPFLIVWDYTKACNLRCKHCYEDAGPKPDPDELTTEEAKSAIDEFADAGVVTLAFSGGEPLARKDFFEVARYAAERDFYVTLATNGTLITKDTAKKLKDTWVQYVEISLDGFEKTHDEFRGIPGAWRRTVQGIKNCVEVGLDTCVATTATHYNLEEISRLMEFAEKELFADRFIVFNYVPTRRGKDIIKEDLTPKEREKLLDLLYSRLIDSNCRLDVFSTAPQYAVASLKYAEGPAVATHFTNQAAISLLRGRTKTLTEFIGGCVSPDTKILLSNGCCLPIQDLEEKWNKTNILSCNLETKKLESTGLMRYININSQLAPDSRVFEIKTKEIGRRLKATGDHPIFTKRGKIQLKDLKIGDRVIVLPLDPVKFEKDDTTVLDEESIKSAAHPKSKIGRIISELKRLNLLPLKLSNTKIAGITRIMGHLFGDGSFYSESFQVGGKLEINGKVKDLEEIRQDIISLGFHPSRIRRKKCKSTITEADGKKRNVEGLSISASVHSIVLFTFLKALGAPVGNKAEINFSVPYWVRKAPKWVKQEFLAAYFGSELEKPSFDKNGTTFNNPRFSVNKTLNALNSGKIFVNDIRKILAEFGVKVSSVSIKPSAIRKNGDITYKIQVKISAKLKNLGNLYGKIGYKYNKERERLARYSYEYILLKIKHIESLLKAYRFAKKMRKQGLMPMEITRKLKSKGFEINYYLIRHWIFNKIKNKSLIGKSKKFIKFKDWLKNARVGNGLVWEIIESIKQIKCENVRDVTTFSKNHNFFANSFLTGNCGAGRLYCGLEPNGDVQPCVFIPIKIGNIREQRLVDIWRNSPVLEQIRDRERFEGCGGCEHKYVCGGCRARAYGYFNDLQAPDPSCSYNQKYWDELLKE